MVLWLSVGFRVNVLRCGEQSVSSKAVVLSDYMVLDYVASQLLYLMPFSCLLRAAEGRGESVSCSSILLNPCGALCSRRPPPLPRTCSVSGKR